MKTGSEQYLSDCISLSINWFSQWCYGIALALGTVSVYAVPGLAMSVDSDVTPAQQDVTPAEQFEATQIEQPLSELSLEAVHLLPDDAEPVLLTQTEPESLEPDDTTPAFGTAGKQRWYLQGAAASDFDDDVFGLAGAGVSHFFADGHSVNLELNGMAFDQPGDNAVGLNLALLVRSHWIRGENWSLYVDGGAGILGTTDDVPSSGSSFNFTPQVGGGATVRINDDQRLMMGLRWHHISNANLYEGNPGLDTLMGYVGINFPIK